MLDFLHLGVSYCYVSGLKIITFWELDFLCLGVSYSDVCWFAFLRLGVSLLTFEG